MSEGIDSVTSEIQLCKSCVLSNQTRKPFSGTRRRASRPLELIHSDVCGPSNVESYDCKRYFVTFIDDYTHMTAVFLMRCKSEVFLCFKKYAAMAEAHHQPHRIEKIRCDNGGEYSSNEMKNFCAMKGIVIEYTTPYDPELNGVAERMNRTLLEKARAMLTESSLAKFLWGEAIMTATYLANRSPTSSLEKMTPYEMWYQHKPKLSHLKVFGCTAFVHIPKGARKKFDNRSVECVLVGYECNGYRLWNKNSRKIVYSSSVTFDEKENEPQEIEGKSWDNIQDKINKCDCTNDIIGVSAEGGESTGLIRDTRIDFEQNEEASDEGAGNVHDILSDEEGDNALLLNNVNVGEEFLSAEEEDQPLKEYPRRNRKAPERYGYLVTDDILCFNVSGNIPRDYKDIKGHVDEINWLAAVNEELSSLNENCTWDVVKRPPDVKLIGTRWVFTIKSGNKLKARLVAKGFMQKENIDYSDTYSPVARLPTIRTLFAVGIQKGFFFQQMDVKTAFLHGYIEEDVYLQVPEGVIVDDGCVLKLNRSLYGLKQSPKCWNIRFHNYISSLGFTNSNADYCLYYKRCDVSIVYLLLYVDDMIICGENLRSINKLKEDLSNEFKMKDLGEIKTFMGINFNHDKINNIVTLDQQEYISKILEKFDMTNCNSISIPMEPKLYLKKHCGKQTLFPYRELLGSLMYLMIATRPDLCYAICYLSRFQDSASDEHWQHLKKVLRYVKGTKDMKLVYRRNSNDSLIGYVDSDWANDEERKSTSGYIFKIFGNSVLWASKKQTLVTTSTTDAEYVAAWMACREAIWLSKLLSDMQLPLEGPVKLYEDNAGCIFISKNPETKRSKHIDVKFHYVRECVWNKKIELVYIESSNQLADIFTKSLSKQSFWNFLFKIGIQPGGVLEIH